VAAGVLVAAGRGPGAWAVVRAPWSARPGPGGRRHGSRALGRK